MKYFLRILLLLPGLCPAQVHLGPGQAFPNIAAAALAHAIHPGDTVYLHSGAYGGYQGVADVSGTASDWIVIRPYPQATVEIAGTWQFIRCSYLRFEDLDFKGNDAHPGRLLSLDNGGSCATPSRHIVVENCRFSHVTDPAAITAFKMSGVDSFEVRDCVFQDFPVCDAMDFNVCSEGLIIGNRLENCLSGGHIKGGASNIRMEGNLFIQASMPSWVAFELGGDTGAQFYCPEDSFEVRHLQFFSNIIVGGYRGLALSSARDCEVRNNTFYQCGQATLRFLTTSNLYPELSGNILENNLFVFGASAYINGGVQPAVAAEFSHNLYMSSVQAVFNGPYWDPELAAIKDPAPLLYGSGTPMFVDAANGDFHLAPGSPAIGNGKSANEPVFDFYGRPYSSAARSIGAVASPEASAVLAPEHRVAGRIFPNPAKDFLYTEGFEKGEKVLIFNSFGQLVAQGDAENAIGVETLAPGVYWVRVGAWVGAFCR